MLHASSEWTRAHLEESAEEVEDVLAQEFWNVVGLPAKGASYRTAHRWRFALLPEPLAESCLFDAEMNVAACGDWCAGPRVEGACLSGMSAAGRVMGLLKTGDAPIVPERQHRSLF